MEFRTDRLRSLSVLEHLPERKLFPAIITDKTTSGAATRRIPLQAAAAGFDFVDVDLNSGLTKSELKEIRANGAELIVSFHDHSATPSKAKLRKILHLVGTKGGDICKIITTATSIRDNLTVLDFLDESSKDNRVVCFAMGDLGIPSRILSPLFGSEFTFAALNERSLTAPGQLTIDNLRSVWNLIGIR